MTNSGVCETSVTILLQVACGEQSWITSKQRFKDDLHTWKIPLHFYSVQKLFKSYFK